MGIVDDYYGGYETLAMFTDYETGDVDFESAYNWTNFGEGFNFPNCDSDEFEDEEQKAQFYQILSEFRTGEMRRELRSSAARPGRNSRNARNGGRGRGRGAGSTAAAAGQPVPGWQAIEQYTMSGQQLYSGNCSSCGEQCTVPFRPVQGRSPPCCRACHAAGKQQCGAEHAAGRVEQAQPSRAAAAAVDT